MDPRKLKRLLDTYREAGVSEVQLDDKLQPTRVVFGAPLVPVPEGDVHVEPDTSWAAPALDLQGALAKIRAKYQQAPKGKRS